MAETDTTLPYSPGTPSGPPGEAAAGRRSERSGIRKLGYDVLHRRRRFRQLAGAAFVFFVTGMGRPETALFWTGTALACLGMAVRLWASGFVVKNEVLATTGPYARVRHPLYVGNILICAGFCAASGLWWSVPLGLAVLLVFYPQTIRYEDQKLRRLFPEQWDAWASRTRALLPSTEPYRDGDPAEASSWSLGLSMMRNGEPVHVAVILACLVYLHYQV